MADEPEATQPDPEEVEGGPVKTFLEHLEDLRWTLIKVTSALAVAMLVCLLFLINALLNGLGEGTPLAGLGWLIEQLREQGTGVDEDPAHRVRPERLSGPRAEHEVKAFVPGP